jgi:hypothetical protein
MFFAGGTRQIAQRVTAIYNSNLKQGCPAGAGRYICRLRIHCQYVQPTADSGSIANTCERLPILKPWVLRANVAARFSAAS